MAARYLLVIQFSDRYFQDVGEIAAFEDKLVASLPRTCKVEGHELGAGATSFLVQTNAPLAAHRAFRKYIGTRAVERHVRIAFRMVKTSTWMNVWPFRDARPFALAYEPGQDPFTVASKRAIPKRSKPGVSKRATRARQYAK
jgi:hypothetical protein